MPGTKQRAKPLVTHVLHDVDGTPVLEIRVERPRSMRSDYYAVARSPSDFGRAARLTKIGSDGSAYGVCLEDAGTTHCGCRGHAAYGRCRHVEALRWLLERGAL